MLEKGFQRKQRRLTLLHVRRHHVTEAGAGGLAFQRAAASPPDGNKIEMRIQGSERSQQLSTKEDGCPSSESYGYLWLRAELFWMPSRSQLQTRGSAIFKGMKNKRRKVNRNSVAMQNAGKQEWAFPSDLGPHKRTSTEAGRNPLPKLGVLGPFTGDFGQLDSELPMSAELVQLSNNL